MNAGEVLQYLVSLSGRRDLVKQDGTTDNGGLFFINSGIRLLDLLQDNMQTVAWHFDSIVSGDYVVEVPYFRSIPDKTIYLISSTERVKVVEKDLFWITNNYTELSTSDQSCLAETNLINASFLITQPNVPSRVLISVRDKTLSLTVGTITIAGVDENGDNNTEVISIANGAGTYKSAYIWASIDTFTVGSAATLGGAGDETIEVVYPRATSSASPSYYARIPLGVSTQLQGMSTRKLRIFRDARHLHTNAGKFSGSETYEGLLLVPAANDFYTLEMMARFYSKQFSALTDTNYWSERFPELLILASIASIDSFYSNTQGYKDKLVSINLILNGIDEDIAIDSEGEGSQLENSWNN
uniref:Uncharacterized protein n=1 Tax=viral metagenome TaxID=1070528 RepID=A0A6M3KRJ8_9ZZZZ